MLDFVILGLEHMLIQFQIIVFLCTLIWILFSII